MELVGHNDLQGRSGYQPLIINQDGRQIAYVGHHNNQQPLMNPLSGKVEAERDLDRRRDRPGQDQIPHAHSGPPRDRGGRWSADGARVQRQHAAARREGQVVTAAAAWRAARTRYGTSPTRRSRRKLTTVVDNLTGTHKSWWECDTGIAYLVANNSKEGWTGGNHLKIYDLSDPAKPVYIRDFGMVGTQPERQGGIG